THEVINPKLYTACFGIVGEPDAFMKIMDVGITHWCGPRRIKNRELGTNWLVNEDRISDFPDDRISDLPLVRKHKPCPLVGHELRKFRLKLFDGLMNALN